MTALYVPNDIQSHYTMLLRGLLGSSWCYKVLCLVYDIDSPNGEPRWNRAVAEAADNRSSSNHRQAMLLTVSNSVHLA